MPVHPRLLAVLVAIALSIIGFVAGGFAAHAEGPLMVAAYVSVLPLFVLATLMGKNPLTFILFIPLQYVYAALLIRVARTLWLQLRKFARDGLGGDRKSD